MEEKQKKEILELFGENLKAHRISAGFSQEELAEKADLDRSYLGGIERGEHNLALINIIKISSALGVPPHKLFEVFEFNFRVK